MNYFRPFLIAILLSGCTGPKLLNKVELLSLAPEKCVKPTTSCAVEIRYTILPNGSTTNEVIVKSSRIRQCDHAAVRAIRQWRYSEISEATTRTETLSGSICVVDLPEVTKPKVDPGSPPPTIE